MESINEAVELEETSFGYRSKPLIKDQLQEYFALVNQFLTKPLDEEQFNELYRASVDIVNRNGAKKIETNRFKLSIRDRILDYIWNKISFSTEKQYTGISDDYELSISYSSDLMDGDVNIKLKKEDSSYTKLMLSKERFHQERRFSERFPEPTPEHSPLETIVMGILIGIPSIIASKKEPSSVSIYKGDSRGLPYKLNFDF